MTIHASRFGFVEHFIGGGYVQLPDPSTGLLRPMELYPLQARFCREVLDTVDPLTGARRYRIGLYSTPKKFGKTGLAAPIGLHELFFGTEFDREIYSVAGDFDQAMIMLERAKRIIARSPRLQAFGAQIYHREIIFDDDRGTHRWRALAADGVTDHGVAPSLVLIDEGHQITNYDVLEALANSPQRRDPLQIWTTYAGLRAQMVDGNPLFDLYKRMLAKSDPTLYAVWVSGLKAYGELPPGFIRDGYLEEQRRLLPANRFTRLHLNEWGARDVGFLTDDEIASAVTTLAPLLGDQVPHVLSIDYGRSRDHTAMVWGKRKGVGTVQVSGTKLFQGTPEHPVPLEVVERETLDVVQRFAVERIIVDPWQMVGSAERLSKILKWPMFTTDQAAKNPWRRAIVLQPIGASYLNQLTMSLLGLFRSGQIEVPSALTDLLAQLGAVVTRDTFYGVRIDSSAGVGVRGHDDLVIALGMMTLAITARGSSVDLPDFECTADRSRPGSKQSCFLQDPVDGIEWPYRIPGLCQPCVGWQHLQTAHRQAETIAGEPISIKLFNQQHVRRRPHFAGFASVAWL